MKIVFQNLIVLFSFIAYNYICFAKSSVKIGAFFNEAQSFEEINWNVIQHHISPEIDFQAPASIIVRESNSFETYQTFCGAVAANEYLAVFGPRHAVNSETIESICSTFQIPYIKTHWSPIGSKENPSSFNLYPDADLFSKGLATIIQSLDWDGFVVIYENEESLAKLQDVLKIQLFQEGLKRNNVLVKQLGPGPDYRPLLKDVAKLIPRKIVLDCNVDKVMDILKQGMEVRLLDDFSTGIFLSSLDAHTLDLSNLKLVGNITTIRLFEPNSPVVQNAVARFYPEINTGKLLVETALQHDAMLLFAKSINSLVEKNQKIEFSTVPKYCNRTLAYEDHLNLINEMQEVLITDGITGQFALENGKRRIFNLEVIEFRNPDKPIGLWNSENPEHIHLTRNATERELEFQKRMQTYNFIVSSKIAEPYLMDAATETVRGRGKYEGFAMDLITEIANSMNLNFTFVIANNNLTTVIVDDLVNRRADLGICDFTITQQRSEQIDFSLPFMSLGISILYTEMEQEDIDNMYAFMKPFSWSVWIYIITLYLMLSIVILVIARLDPDDWENPHPCNQTPEELENIWGIKNCLWLTLGSIMTQGCDILPKGSCSRTATAMWWFFSLIMTSTYTANLAAFLTESKKDNSIKNVETLANQNTIKYGVVTNGSTQTFFENSNNTIYQKMWATMKNENPSVFEDDNAKGVERVLNTKQGLYAFFMESPQIEYELERNCDLKKLDQYLDSKSYGIGMPLGAEYRHRINAVLLTLKENGRITELKTKWWTEKNLERKQCDKGLGEDNQEKLTLANVGGAFILLAVGIGLAFVFAIAEFLWNVHNISVEEHMSYLEALKCEVKFACNIRVTRKAAKPVISESSSSKSDGNISMARTILAGAGSFLNINASVLHRFGQAKPDPE